ncbi:MAG: recombinase family protein [Synergistaceae bacterium]|jgi:DNA invertase Pin-like site-specific DNA recombinase|nr:recombinase family protein [Synergistaceae bacterium]
MMQNQLFGYIRVSTAEQHDDRQRTALAPYNIPERNLYVDKQSGKDFNRPGYERLMKRIHNGDLLYIKSIDRLGRNYDEIIKQWHFITHKKGTDIKVLDMPLLDTTYGKDLLGSFISDLVLQIMSFAAQIERENILQRQNEGIASAKSRGVKFGRKPLPLPENFNELCARWIAGEFNSHTLAALCGFSRRTLFARLKSLQETKDNYL